MIFLYGPPGSGKSTLGRRLAETLSLAFYDLDEDIERQTGMEISAIFETEGEPGFRRREAEILQDTLDKGSAVVALGGGALLADDNRSKVFTAGKVLCLSASVDTLTERLREDRSIRPLLNADLEGRTRDLIEERSQHYASFPHQLNTEGRSLTDAIAEAEILLGAFRVRGMGSGYDVRARTGVLERIAEFISPSQVQGPVVLVSDETIGELYAARMIKHLQEHDLKVVEMRFPPGERQKSLETASAIWEFCAQSGVERKGMILALGGGVVGDLAGFAAAAYLRGVPWLNLPTTLLAMIDASLGGKTGINLSSGKNLVGSFNAPKAVLADLDTLRTLPEVEMRNGMAEVVKHGIIADPTLFEICEQGLQMDSQRLNEMVCRAMAVKIKIIQLDPYEGGIREQLNLGHTVGHAVEAASDFTIPHGEAVAIGMVAEARLSERLGYSADGLSDRLVSTLSRIGLPIEIPPSMDRNRLFEAMKFDKKRRSGVLRFALPISIGRMKSGIEVEPEDVQKIFG
jgi:3-dehydroquinate synthase